MKKILLMLLTATASLVAVTGCIEEINPQSTTATGEQVSNAPNAFKNYVAAITSTLAGQFTYAPDDTRAYDFGYPAFYLMRDIMGQDVVYPYQNWFSAWYGSSNLGPSYAYSQLPWTYYYGWIKSCNTVISLAGEKPSEEHTSGAGIAYAMRALFYMDLARMYAPKTYSSDKKAETVPIVTEATSLGTLANNPRATNEQMWAFILSDLDKAEQYLANYDRSDVYTPNLSVVYGLKARAYLVMEDWSNAQKYAKMAQNGYNIMSEADYTSRETGFNTPNSSWMFGLTYKADDPNILKNDGDSSWGSMMCIEVNPTVSGCGYAANYGQPFLIDRHLYETIPSTDFRKKCYVDFAIDELSETEAVKKLAAYSDHPDWIYNSGHAIQGYSKVGGLPLKFRTAGGEVGRNNQHVGFIVAVPMMRVEEMYLIEAEAAGMQNEAEGIALLTAFAKKRDSNYTYGTHTDSYGNSKTSTFQNEIWWQRRVEFWGEGFATYDIKRLNKGIIRSYSNTNHTDGYRWNTPSVPDWMNFCIVQTETNYNKACTNNPDPIAPKSNSSEYVW
ncbi:RagB/SusD family nutrient uptake outer membrane protein [Bacteroidaceae bacterium HV4-6-C5C]|jgi:SusD family.|nr:RagB/SusD family nutrient uptake outer membrane protein [Bacteroidaceae bacterium HV4-6-C5C]